ncbi:hypothetical protein PPL_03904 [Heterostelium album PN500]|uniref:Uncharacterized protein n=1 Tax=Heterostelium pallidum (strain ATCC 26659 / Pp 5 / PN500) TaxID=670386 RepID=D3B5G6_HETP5|nr:hypothetical protein PPL_03904 [Heterostelium album PN500]EFA83114.1 hypothetical protein PPL_03904 [Heterostelium album PN500]|eukprot:XP_020435231.1 hypothetical protein PPL_03904 [Heterostelium album PN500]
MTEEDFDRYYQEADLYKDLLNLKVFACGTIKSNRTIFPEFIYERPLKKHQ